MSDFATEIKCNNNFFSYFSLDICPYGKPISDDSIFICVQCARGQQCVRDDNNKVHCCQINPALGPCKKEVKLINPDIADAFVPHCSKDGWYKKEQCYDFEDRECWCVARDGAEIPDSRVVGLGNSADCTQEKYMKYYGECAIIFYYI